MSCLSQAPGSFQLQTSSRRCLRWLRASPSLGFRVQQSFLVTPQSSSFPPRLSAANSRPRPSPFPQSMVRCTVGIHIYIYISHRERERDGNRTNLPLLLDMHTLHPMLPRIQAQMSPTPLQNNLPLATAEYADKPHTLDPITHTSIVARRPKGHGNPSSNGICCRFLALNSPHLLW